MFQSTLGAFRPVVDQMLDENGPMITNARKAGMPESHIQLIVSSFRKVMSNLYNIYKVSLVDYLSKEALEEYAAFAQSPLGQKHAIYMQKVQNIADVASDDFLTAFQKRLESGNMKSAVIKSSVADYVGISRTFPEFIPYLYRPYLELKVAEGMYEGETRDRRPYGKGKLTDKKGVVYEGDFKNGMRHGLLMVTKPGKETVSQFWIAGKYRKDVPLTNDKDGVLPKPYFENDMRYGYGSAYNSDTKSRLQGFFIDGQLHGKGVVYENDRTVEGEFVNGNLVSGVITWDLSPDRKSVFRGRMSGNVSEGIREWKSQENNESEMHLGSFISGLQDGVGQRTIVRVGSRIQASGTYAYGRVYGPGFLRQQVVDQDTGIREVQIYEGCFFADIFHGQGRLQISLSNIPDGSWTFTRCNVALPGFSAEKMDVVMEGTFEDGFFKKGKITYSDGSWFDGIFGEPGLVQGEMFKVYPDGSSYLGGCLDGKYHGDGLIRYADGTEYKRRFEYGEAVEEKPEQPKPDMSNVIRYDQQTYEFRDLSSGFGNAALIKPAGVKVMVRSSVTSLKAICKGRFRGNTLLEGKVTMTDGTWLEGEFEDGILIKGKGKIIDKYRTVYEGDIKNGYPHGQGKCTYTDGTWFVGKFANGNRMDGIHYAADGNVIKVYK
jgi:hypothetical protein